MTRSGDFFLRRVGDQDLLVPLGGRVMDMNALIALNPTGRYIWELLADDHPEESLVSKVADRFNVDSERARSDVRAFLDDLTRLGLLAS